MNIKLLNEHNLDFLSLKEGYTGSSESIHVKMPHCWKSHVAAHLSFNKDELYIFKIFLKAVHRKTLILSTNVDNNR